jgi:hypothetical protein
VGGFFVFPVGGVWFDLQDLRFFPTYSVAFFSETLFLNKDWTVDNVQKTNNGIFYRILTSRGKENEFLIGMLL